MFSFLAQDVHSVQVMAIEVIDSRQLVFIDRLLARFDDTIYLRTQPYLEGHVLNA